MPAAVLAQYRGGRSQTPRREEKLNVWAFDAATHDITRLRDQHYALDIVRQYLETFSIETRRHRRERMLWIGCMYEKTLCIESDIPLSPMLKRRVDALGLSGVPTDHVHSLLSRDMDWPGSHLAGLL
jgi:hypothetical protein